MAQFELEITTPEKRFFDEPVEMVVLPATDGELGVLADHAPMVLVHKERLRPHQEGRTVVRMRYRGWLCHGQPQARAVAVPGGRMA